MNAVEFSHVSKRFGAQTVLDDLSFDVPEHSVFGFLGQNGAGKTTSMKLLLGLLEPDGGSITALGRPVRFSKPVAGIGYLPDVPAFYRYMTPREYLRLCGDISGMDRRNIRSRSDELLELVGLKEVRKRIGGFSRGMKQRLGIAQALLDRPRLLICDEPTSALDPVGRKEILDILSQAAAHTTVLFSTHILSDVERICDQIAVLHGGRISLAGSMEDIRSRRRQNRLLIDFADSADRDRFAALPALRPFLADAERTAAGIILTSVDIGCTERQVLTVLAEQSLLPVRLEQLEPTLESLFMEAVQ